MFFSVFFLDSPPEAMIDLPSFIKLTLMKGDARMISQIYPLKFGSPVDYVPCRSAPIDHP